jgi:hypothetical protein
MAAPKSETGFLSLLLAVLTCDDMLVIDSSSNFFGSFYTHEIFSAYSFVMRRLQLEHQNKSLLFFI